MTQIVQTWQRQSGGFSLLELLLLMALLLLFTSWSLRVASRDVQKQGMARAVHSLLQEAVERAEAGPVILLLGDRSGTEELRELVLAERHNGQLVLRASSHLQFPSGVSIVPPNVTVPVVNVEDILPGRWLAVEFPNESFRLILRSLDGTGCHFSLSENGSVLQKFHKVTNRTNAETGHE